MMNHKKVRCQLHIWVEVHHLDPVAYHAIRAEKGQARVHLGSRRIWRRIPKQQRKNTSWRRELTHITVGNEGGTANSQVTYPH